ncbi:hypothetical protein OG963_01210 [Streptomyces sp. NBC_01707]|uniref:hypothetical protein n=1 Tax=unclassified Streptomyces TaxID=2593676 RepID=UPI0029A00E9B|nr:MULTISPECIES: hypothetical protein [unclassified Streptomyces]MDX3771787.1 hypothetical protein [Streptomyces sp. AK08-01B]MDX3821339.1 hypothetical protein [Streptomyces sp. AK08-01A]
MAIDVLAEDLQSGDFLELSTESGTQIFRLALRSGAPTASSSRVATTGQRYFQWREVRPSGVRP